jgi:type I restriction-modification system DNA methylase subunit
MPKKDSSPAKARADIDFEKELWDAANELRGAVAENQYKDYVLSLLFLKHLSERYEVRQQEIKLADVLLAKGTQFNELLKRGVNNGWEEEEGFKLNEAERLELLEVSASNIRKAMELKLRCDEIIREACELNPALSVSLQKYQNHLRLKNLASQ